jgi:hypothetical protein
LYRIRLSFTNRFKAILGLFNTKVSPYEGSVEIMAGRPLSGAVEGLREPPW